MTTSNTPQPPKLNKFFELICGTVEVTNEMVEKNFTVFERDLETLLNHEDTTNVRIFFGFSRNLGHRANTINIMNRLIGYLSPTKRLTFDMVFDLYDSQGATNIEAARQEFADAIVKLVPFIHRETVMRNKQCTLITNLNVTLDFYGYNGSTKRTEIPLPAYRSPLAITGGFDETENLASTLNATWLVCITPYQFLKYEAYNTVYYCYATRPKEGNLLGPLYNFQGTTIIDGKVGYYGATFSRCGYYLPDAEKDTPLWKEYATEHTEKYELVMQMLKRREENAVELMPVYFSRGRTYCEPEEFFFNLIAGLFFYKGQQEQAKKKCTVVIIFGGLNKEDYAKFVNIIEGKRVEFVHLNEYIADVLEPKSKRFLVGIENEPTPAELDEAIEKATPEGIVIVQLGPMPNYISNYLFTKAADLPAVFEGEGSASLLLNEGKPYLHLVSVDIRRMVGDRHEDPLVRTNQLYPTIPLEVESCPSAEFCHLVSLDLIRPLSYWNEKVKAEKGLPGLNPGFFFSDAYNDEVLVSYFKEQRLFFHYPPHDKLMMALGFMMAENKKLT